MLEDGMPLARVLSACFGEITGTTLTFRNAIDDYLKHSKVQKRASSSYDDRVPPRAARARDVGGEAARRAQARGLHAVDHGATGVGTVTRLRSRREGETPRGVDAAARLGSGSSTARSRRASAPTTLIKDLNLASHCSSGRSPRATCRRTRSRPFARRRSSRRREGQSGPLSASGGRVALADAFSGVFRVFVQRRCTRRGARAVALRWRSVDLERREITIGRG